jgi:hypothetical protein
VNPLDNNPTPVELTEESLERMLIDLAKLPGGKLQVNYCCVSRFEVVGPYCPVHQPDLPTYVHEIYPTGLADRPQYITLLMSEWPPGTFPPHPGDV